MISNQPIESLIWMFNHYKRQAEMCLDNYEDIVQGYFMYDFNMEMAGIYEEAILARL